MSNEWYPVGGNGGIPSDMMSSGVIGDRKLKVLTRGDALEGTINGLVYSFSGSVPSVPGDVISLNIVFAATSIISCIESTPGFRIEVRSEPSTGDDDGIVSAVNLNIASPDETPA